MSPSISSKRWRLSAAIALFFFCAMLTACSKPDVSVSLHGVNYSDQVFSYSLEDPNDPSNNGGGETIDRYAAGGTMCCYSVPKKWHSGIKIIMHSKYWLPKRSDGTLPEIKNTQTMDISKYSEPGDLWIVRTATGEIDIVLSDTQPDSPKWPGSIKGWPVPSLSYQRERWKLYMNHAMGGVKLYEELLDEMRDNPDTRSKDAWNYTYNDDPKSRAKFTGPDDKNYRKYLIDSYKNSLIFSKDQVQTLEENKP